MAEAPIISGSEEKEPLALEVRQNAKDGVFFVHDQKKVSPIIDDHGDIYVSAAAASLSLGLKKFAVSNAMRYSGVLFGKFYRRATLEEVLAHGAIDQRSKKTKIRSKNMKATTRKVMTADGKSTVTVYSTRQREGASTETVPGDDPIKPAAVPAKSFYAVKWPDGSRTIYMAPGVVWTLSIDEKIPAAILAATSFVSWTEFAGNKLR